MFRGRSGDSLGQSGGQGSRGLNPSVNNPSGREAIKQARAASKAARAAFQTIMTPEEKRREARRRHRKTPGGKARAARYRKRRRQRMRGEGKVTRARWQAILLEFEGRCIYCGTDEDISQEHLVPLSKGGQHVTGNVVPTCRACNASKGDSHLLNFLMQ